MTYPTPCCVKGCVHYVSLAAPLPSNIRFVCPSCEDAIMRGLLERLNKAGLISRQMVTDSMDVVAQFRRSARKAIDPLGIVI